MVCHPWGSFKGSGPSVYDAGSPGVGWYSQFLQSLKPLSTMSQDSASSAWGVAIAQLDRAHPLPASWWPRPPSHFSFPLSFIFLFGCCPSSSLRHCLTFWGFCWGSEGSRSLGLGLLPAQGLAGKASLSPPSPCFPGTYVLVQFH